MRSARESTPVTTKTIEVGDLFNYEIANPVTVRRNGAALVPIYQGFVNCRSIALYNQITREKVFFFCLY